MKILLILFPIGNKIAGTGCWRQVNIFVSRLFQGCLSTHIGGQIRHTWEEAIGIERKTLFW